jgi:hypothetical protein
MMGKSCVNSEEAATWCCFHLILLIIGLPMYFSGCYSSEPGFLCPARKLRLGNLTRVDIKNGICCQVTGGMDGGQCVNKDFTCCSSILFWSFEDRHCEEVTGTKRNCTVTLGQQKEWLWDPNSNLCSTTLRSKRLWIAGIVFLSLDLMLWIVCCTSQYKEYLERRGDYVWTGMIHEMY